MFRNLLRLFGIDRLSQIKKKIDLKYKEALHYQRNGKLREYAQTMNDIEELEKKYLEFEVNNEN
jgi:hypothetical protein